MIDWIERIPFSETRNYVQRVLENTQIYRNVLAGRDVPLAIASDLKRGAYTAVASAVPQFSSSPAPAASPIPGMSPVQTPAPTATDAQAVTVVSSKPVYDDEDEAEPVKKTTKKATTKKKKKKKRKSRTS
jgi:soluble lytic murein transglycosylase